MKVYRWAAAAAGLMLIATAPAAAIDFEQRLKQIDGTEFTDGKPEDATLRRIVVNALLGTYPDEQNLDPNKKLERFFLAKKIQDGGRGDVPLTAEEIALVKTLVGKAYQPLIVGQAWMMLDPGVKR